MSPGAEPRTSRACRALLAAALAGGVLAVAVPPAAAADGAALRAPAQPCRTDQLVANSAERVGATGWRITVVNDGPRPCTLGSHPRLALAGQGSPDRNRPLTVTLQGRPQPVLLPVGGTAATVVTFTPVLGEADGYCASGADPTVAPSLVVGFPNSRGGLQLAPDDGGEFALCGGTVRATPFRAVPAN
ncbi:Tat pathway signal sequence domain protein [Streptomyces globosus]|uniref:Tat pathway signal sequence domain protein n=1 Tax=Streptomyces globosus TaxID=68209 RepID=A0A344U0Q3_9ACTN|nr:MULTISPECIES: DUF4232 domain-containing protein [Streptomyces]AXE24474.1 Tat pathway signal sequence domain protein [Streptomyces globosus]